MRPLIFPDNLAMSPSEYLTVLILIHAALLMYAADEADEPISTGLHRAAHALADILIPLRRSILEMEEEIDWDCAGERLGRFHDALLARIEALVDAKLQHVGSGTPPLKEETVL